MKKQMNTETSYFLLKTQHRLNLQFIYCFHSPFVSLMWPQYCNYNCKCLQMSFSVKCHLRRCDAAINGQFWTQKKIREKERALVWRSFTCEHLAHYAISNAQRAFSHEKLRNHPFRCNKNINTHYQHIHDARPPTISCFIINFQCLLCRIYMRFMHFIYHAWPDSIHHISIVTLSLRFDAVCFHHFHFAVH